MYSSFHLTILVDFFSMTPKNFCLLLVVLIWSIEFVTCSNTQKPCTPAMNELCDKFCAQDPMSSKNQRYCPVNRYYYQCLEYNSNRRYRPCEKSAKDMCSPIQKMIRCSDESIVCRCGRKAADGSNEFCYSNSRTLNLDCPPEDKS